MFWSTTLVKEKRPFFELYKFTQERLHYLSIFGIQSNEENEKLSQSLQEIYNDELNHYLAIDALCENLRKALNHIHGVLGWPGLLKPEKVPEAAMLLAEYGKAFMRIESKANYRVLQIRELIKALS